MTDHLSERPPLTDPTPSLTDPTPSLTNATPSLTNPTDRLHCSRNAEVVTLHRPRKYLARQEPRRLELGDRRHGLGCLGDRLLYKRRLRLRLRLRLGLGDRLLYKRRLR